jgi:hypothetical protein
MQLNPAAFNSFIAGIGQRVQWRRSHACPCVNRVSGAAKPGCPVCAARGRFWDEAKDAVIGIASQNTQKRWAQMGRYEAGDAVVVVPENTPVYEAGQFDRVRMLNSTDRFSLPLLRGAPDERLPPAVEEVTRVFWLSQGGVLPLIEGNIPERISEVGGITWGDGAPPDGTTYTIEGTKFSEYYVFDQMPSDRNEHSGARLPRKIVLRSFDLFGR